MFTLMAALEQGEIPADTILGSYPCVIPDPNSIAGKWDPTNAEGESAGVLTLTDATVESVNCAYARLVKLVGPDKVVDVARRMGVKNADLQPVLSITLGSRDVTPLEMASAYSTLANDGEYHEPYFIDRVEDRDGNVLFKQAIKPERAVSVANARTVVQTLEQVVQRGTGVAAAVPKWQVAGKTGSTDNNVDAWFVGVTPKLATAVWMGDPASNDNSMYNVGVFPKVFGGTYPAMIFSAYMKQFLAGQAVVDFALPDRVPNQRAPKYLNLEGELTQSGGPRAPQNLSDLNQQARNNTGNNNTAANNNNATNNNAPAPTVPRAPVITVPDPVVPQVPVVTVPSFPDVTVPRGVFVPPVVEDTTPTTRRNRG
jgi:penicillin-binding protein 1A